MEINNIKNDSSQSWGLFFLSKRNKKLVKIHFCFLLRSIFCFFDCLCDLIVKKTQKTCRKRIVKLKSSYSCHILKHVINKVFIVIRRVLHMQGSRSDYERLSERIRQHEALITQLMSIIAATNGKVSDLSKSSTETYSEKAHLNV